MAPRLARLARVSSRHSTGRQHMKNDCLVHRSGTLRRIGRPRRRAVRHPSARLGQHLAVPARAAVAASRGEPRSTRTTRLRGRHGTVGAPVGTPAASPICGPVGMAVPQDVRHSRRVDVPAAAARLPAARGGRGLVFGTAFFALVDELLVPALRLTPGPRAFSWRVHARGAASHLAYGVAAESAARLLAPRQSAASAAT